MSELPRTHTISGGDSGGSIGRYARKHLNFYRVHLLFFAITPLFFSAIFYASNGEFHISYIDALFNSVSAMTVCGIATVDLSSLTGWQQAILFIQMCLGSPVLISWFMVYIRRHYFAKKFEHIVTAELASRAAYKLESGKTDDNPSTSPSRWPQRFTTLFRKRTGLSTVEESTEKQPDKKERGGGVIRKLRPDMIRRMDDAPKLVDPSGWISEGQSAPTEPASIVQSPRQLAFADHEPPGSPDVPLDWFSRRPVRPTDARLTRLRRLSDPGTYTTQSSSASSPHKMQRYETVNFEFRNRKSALPRTTTVEFAPVVPTRGRLTRPQIVRDAENNISYEERPRRSSLLPHPTLTQHSTKPSQRPTRAIKDSGFGGFPTPDEILGSVFRRFFPKLQKQLTRTITIPVSTTIASQHGSLRNVQGSKVVSYISFDAVVGRNSAFHLLTNEQLEELGGVEYRALNALLFIVAGYHIGTQLIAFIVIAPYMSIGKWKPIFETPKQHRFVPHTWFSIFQVISAYTNTGMSLVDQSMVPFQKAYPMIIFMAFLILAGNTAFPIFLRFMIWIIAKLVPKRSRINETLQFLLDHPRRCFIYLFPSHQTWFLLTILVSLNFTDWFCFMVLDIGNPAIDYLPLGVRFADGLLQAVAVRAAGFGTVSLSALAPAVKVLYVMMMYISVYPIAMSVRSTNVYEEQSLGVFRDEESDFENEFQPEGSRMTVWSRYLAMHARKQLAFDMWWLGLALFLVCIIERGAINDTANQGWFNIFTIVFELVSAYGTVGLSLGIPTENYSFSGALRPLSKLIVCFVMLRGRHRGLPVAIDRAVMLPREFRQLADYNDDPSGSEQWPQASQSLRQELPMPYSDSSNEKRRSSEESTMRKRDMPPSNSEEGLMDREKRRLFRADIAAAM